MCRDWQKKTTMFLHLQPLYSIADSYQQLVPQIPSQIAVADDSNNDAEIRLSSVCSAVKAILSSHLSLLTDPARNYNCTYTDKYIDFFAGVITGDTELNWGGKYFLTENPSRASRSDTTLLQ